ncbi:MAG TPA: hypothetical protein VGW39_14825 [Chthoniobacterales bacterium]|nr:hypothetical protein [Chthoniobacterales bacterium]
MPAPERPLAEDWIVTYLPSLHLLTTRTQKKPAAKPAGAPRRARRGRVFGAVPMPEVSSTGPTSTDAVVAAFVNQDMELVDEIQLTPDAAAIGPTRRRGPGVGGEAAETTLALTVNPNEDAVVLLEQDGMYSWQIPTSTTTEAAPAARRGVRSAPPARIITFSITLPDADAPRQRSAKRGMIGDFVFGRVKAFVFKFAARIVVGQAMKYLERNVRRGLVNMAEIDPAKWNLFADPAPLRLPQDRAARVLLFVHGTFSSTIGGYGAMTATPWGEEFLRAAHANYDAVIGFDHPTLSDDPLENATDLLTRLRMAAPAAFRCDRSQPGRLGGAQFSRASAAAGKVPSNRRADYLRRRHQRRDATGGAR